MTDFTQNITCPSLNTTTAVAGAPKNSAETWSDKTTLIYDYVNGYWKSNGGDGPGWAYADGAAGSGNTTANIQIRPWLIVSRIRPAIFNVTGAAYMIKVDKKVGTAWNANVAIYRDGDPSSATYLQCTSAFVSGMQYVGQSALAASAGDASAYLFPTSPGIVPRIRDFRDPSLTQNPPRFPLGLHTDTKPGGSSTWGAGSPVYRDHDGTLTISGSANGAGKTLIGWSLGDYAAGAVPVSWGEFTQDHGFDETMLWMMQTPWIPSIITGYSTAETTFSSAQSVIGATYSLNAGGVMQGDRYIIYVPSLYEYNTDGTKCYGCSAPDLAQPFPYSQLTGAFSGLLPAGINLIYSQVGEGPPLTPFLVPASPSSDYTLHDTVRPARQLLGYQYTTPSPEEAYTPLIHPNGSMWSGEMQASRAAVASAYGKAYSAQFAIVAHSAPGGVTSATAIIYVISITGNILSTNNYSLTKTATVNYLGQEYTLWESTVANPTAGDPRKGETVTYSATTNIGSYDSYSHVLYTNGTIAWPFAILQVNGGVGGWISQRGACPNDAALPDVTLTLTPTQTITTVGQDTKISIDCVCTAAFTGSDQRQGYGESYYLEAIVRRPSDGFHLHPSPSAHWEDAFGWINSTPVSLGAGTATRNITLQLRNPGPSAYNLQVALRLRVGIPGFARFLPQQFYHLRQDLSITLPVT